MLDSHGAPGVQRRYFDWAATAPPDAAPTAEVPFGNPASRHYEGRMAKTALETARTRCAAVLDVEPAHLCFTSGASETNTLVLQSLFLLPGTAGLAYSLVEHPSIRGNAEVLRRSGKTGIILKTEADGRIVEDTLAKAVSEGSGIRMAAVMAVNNETGAINDIPVLCAAVRRSAARPIHFHCDIVQAAGKIPLDLRRWDVDSAALSAHKLGGPRGIGLLYLRGPLVPLARGGDQERGLRPGTENVAGALALADCLERHARADTVAAGGPTASRRMDRLIAALLSLQGCTLIPADRSPGDARFSPFILQAAFRGIPAEVLVRILDEQGIAISTGSACSSRRAQRPVLSAMGVDSRTAGEAVRFSFGWSTTDEDLEALIDALRRVRTSFP